MALELRVDPDRVDAYEGYTGIFVRALGTDDKWGNADIAQLDRKSLIEWLRKEGEKDTLAEKIVLVLLGHSPVDNPYE